MCVDCSHAQLALQQQLPLYLQWPDTPAQAPEVGATNSVTTEVL